MKIITKCVPLLLYFLTLLVVGYLSALYINHDKTFFYNEKYGFYIVIQVIHLILSFSVLSLIWLNNKLDKWKKIDQTILVVCLSIFGLWIWYFKFFKKELHITEK